MPVEGVLNVGKTSEARLSGEAPPALPVEGVLNQGQNERKRG